MATLTPTDPSTKQQLKVVVSCINSDTADTTFSYYDGYTTTYASNRGLLCAAGLGLCDIRNVMIVTNNYNYIERLIFYVCNFNDAIMLQRWKKIFDKYRTIYKGFDSWMRKDTATATRHEYMYPFCVVHDSKLLLSTSNRLHYFGIELDKYGQYIKVELDF